MSKQIPEYVPPKTKIHIKIYGDEVKYTPVYWGTITVDSWVILGMPFATKEIECWGRFQTTTLIYMEKRKPKEILITS
jgi:hypothetical protein